MIILPMLIPMIFCSSVGVKLKNMPISIKNEEVNILDCQYSNTNGCIFDDDHNLTMSCVVVNYLQSLNYKLVSN